ncbi:helix-turn-helix transcriptional regulator [Nocardia anaemiae]|uniref:helix-turn-helix transcriptional regulator n=1 Tax=Nocardia anaemiae TaxID=263910 RepID=UPI001471406D|nr:AAA family ATPase [Nocardia anaemiae]
MSAQRPASIGSLPATTSDFVGRERELEKIASLFLSSTRLITLIGTGGIGKTRLATEAVHRYHKARRVPIHWVRLARLPAGSNATAVEDELAHSIIDVDFSNRSTWDALIDTFTRTDGASRNLQTILVMDNCEHVLDGVGQVIAALLDAVPGLTVLATSREAIGWVDEQLVPVPALSREQALALFRARAELTGHPIAGDDDAAVADSICWHVHNHPLYIRLAAARLMRQPLPMILRDLSGEDSDRRLRWSHGPRVGADQRHWRIHDVIAWSYNLCQDDERLLFERLSVFAAGYDTNPDDVHGPSGRDVGAELEAIEAVCADDDGAGIAREEIEGLLERLVDQSLVTMHLTPNAVRYSLLESLRVFAQRRLRERSAGGEWERLSARHRRYYRDKAVHAGADWFGPAEQELLDWARAAWDNLLTAMDSSLTTPGESAIGLEIATGLIALRLPFFMGSLRESRRWAVRALDATRSLDPQPVELQTSSMALTAWVTMCQGVHDDAARILDECVAACIPDAEVGANWRNDPTTDLGLPAPVDFARGTELLFASDPRSVAVLARARERFLGFGDRGAAAMSELFQALAAGLLGTAAQALPIAQAYLDLATRSGARWAQSWAELAWAIALTKHGDPHEALAVGRTALTSQLSMRDQWGAIWSVHIRTWTLARLIADARVEHATQPDSALSLATEIANLIGGVRTFRQRLGVNIANLGPFATETDNAIATARDVLGHKAFAAAEQEGAMLRPEFDEVARLALGALSLNKLAVDHPVRQHRPSKWSELSTAEREVAVLAAAGWTNTAIAASRGSSFKTVDAQIASIFSKLMINSRADIITLVPTDTREQVAQAAARRPQQRRQR